MLTFAEEPRPTDPTSEHVFSDLSEKEKWTAVLSRDGRFDGVFVFAVRSTEIYCRPSCPARRPAKDKVVFFPGSVEAEQSGFRPCHRCQPRQSGPSPQTRVMERIIEYIEANLQKKLTLDRLSSLVGLSPHHFQRTFKKVLGISPRQYVEARRLARMKTSLKRGETVNDSLFDAGFSSRSRVYERIRGFGVNPGEFRRGGEGLRIQYGIIGSPLGRLLVAATERGVCAVCIGDSDSFVEQSLLEDYPAAQLFRDDERARQWTKAFERYFSGEYPGLNLPVDVRATAFQSKVWKAIQMIPSGQTATYSQIADQLGEPKAFRAVARACATNPVALVIPCHRVVGKDGELRGYRWGKNRKRALLDLEQRIMKKRLLMSSP